MNPSRETIAAALFTQLQTAGSSFNSYSRRPQLWASSGPMPALYLGQVEDMYVYQHGTSTPPLITLDFEVIIYINAGEDPNAIPDTQLNNCIDAVESAMAPTPATRNVQTLGGLVDHAWLEEKITRIPGWINGQGTAILTIKVLVPS